MTNWAGLYGANTIVNQAGVPQPGISVYVYEVGTTTLATLYTDNTGTVTIANPTTTDALGNLSFYAVPGRYTISSAVGSETVAVVPDPNNYTLSTDTPGVVIAQVLYAPSTDFYAGLTSTMTALSPTYLTIPFVVPETGNVRVTATITGSIFLNQGSGSSWGGNIEMAFLTHNTSTVASAYRTVAAFTSTSSYLIQITQALRYDAIVQGLDPGVSLQWDWAALSSGVNVAVTADNGSGGSYINGPAIITVEVA